MSLDLKAKISLDTKDIDTKLKGAWGDAAREMAKSAKSASTRWQAAASLIQEDAKKAAKSTGEAFQSAAQDAKKAAQSAEKTGKEIQRVGKEGSRSTGLLEDAFSDLKAAITATATAALGALAALKAIGDQANVMQAMSPVDLAAIEAANRALGGTVDKLTLAKALQQTNLSTDMFGKAAKAAAIMAKQFGFSKQHMLDAIHNGTLMETQLQALGISAEFLENKVRAWAAAQGIVDVDPVTASMIKAKATIQAINAKAKEWGTNTAQAGDAAAKTLADFKNISREIGEKLLPDILKFMNSIKGALPQLKTVAKFFLGIAKDVLDLPKNITRLFNILAKRIVLIGKIIKATFKRDFALVEQLKMQYEVANLPNHFKKAKSLADKQWNEWKKRQKERNAAPLTLAKERAKAAAIEQRRRRTIADARRKEFLEDLRQRQEQAKDLVRNYTEKIAQVVADQGGSFGEVASGLTDALEKTRMLSSLAWGRKGIMFATKIAAEFQGRKNVDLMKEIQLRAKAAGIQGKALKAAVLIGGWLQGNAKDTLEYLGNEKAANAQLRASLSTLQSTAKISALIVEQNNAFKDITQTRKSAETIINALIERRKELLAGATEMTRKEEKAEAAVISRKIERLQRTAQQYRAIGEERRKILQIAMAHAKVDREIELRSKAMARADALRAAQQQVAAAKAGLASASGPVDASVGIQAQGQQQAAALKAEIAKMQAEVKGLVGKLTAGQSGDDSQQSLLQIQNLNKIIELRRQEIDLIQQKTKAELHGLTLAGQLQKQFATTAAQRAQATAQMMRSSFDSVVGGFTEGLAGVVASAIQGDKDIAANMGKSALDALANLAIQWGSFFALQGAAMLAGYQPQGAVVLAAGVGLGLLGGGLKGLSGLIGPSASSTPSAATSRGATPSPVTSPEKLDKSVRETFVLYDGAPWRQRSKAQDFTEFVNWAKGGGRQTGKRFAIVER